MFLSLLFFSFFLRVWYGVCYVMSVITIFLSVSMCALCNECYLLILFLKLSQVRVHYVMGKHYILSVIC